MPDTNKLVYCRRLPHIQSSLQPLFITWRLKFTLPGYITHELIAMKQSFAEETKHLSLDLINLQAYALERKRFAWLDTQLSQMNESTIDLTQSSYAQIIKDVLHFHAGLRYTLYAFCIMKNHVHVIIQQLMQEDDNPFPLAKITQSWKRHSSAQIKKLSGIDDLIWQAESYDHVIRNEQELSYYLEYTLDNPVNAGLVEKWQDWELGWLNPVFV
jgi:REP element-mobilizing transposase RayT